MAATATIEDRMAALRGKIAAGRESAAEGLLRFENSQDARVPMFIPGAESDTITVVGSERLDEILARLGLRMPEAGNSDEDVRKPAVPTMKKSAKDFGTPN